MILLGTLLLAAVAALGEDALLQKLAEGKFVEARDDAQAVLLADPSSLVANWTMAVVHNETEGNYARALFYLKRAEKLAGQDDSVWQSKILMSEFYVLRDMDRNEEALAVLDRHDAAYPEALPALRIWPLFKIGRTAQALAIGEIAVTSTDWETRRTAYNSLVALTSEQRDRTASYNWMKRGIEATQGRSCILFRNGTGVAYTRFRLQEAEEIGLRAAKAKENDCGGSRAFDELAGLYLLEGEYQKALASLKSLNQEKMLPRDRPQYALTGRWILVLSLHVLGKVEQAERLAAELFTMPQRVGASSGDEATESLFRTYRYLETLDARMQLSREQRSYQSFFAWPSLAPLRMAMTRWRLHRSMLQLLTRDDVLRDSARPNLHSIFEWPAWTISDMIPIVGTGVMAKTLAKARRMDAEFPEAEAYFDAIEGEVAYREGHLDEAHRLALQSLQSLDRHEALLRWRTLAWLGDTLDRQGRADEAVARYQEVLENFPSILRLLDLRVPVTIGDDGTQPARMAAKRLDGSRRFATRKNAAFRLDASTRGDRVEICLSNGSGMQISCADGDNVDAALVAFHAACFSPKVALSQIDLNSLDGSPGRTTADEALKAVLPQ